MQNSLPSVFITLYSQNVIQNCISQNYPKGNIPVTMDRTTKCMQNTFMSDKCGRGRKSNVMCMCIGIYLYGEFIIGKYIGIGRIHYVPNMTPITV
jgi:hypothetical protein